MVGTLLPPLPIYQPDFETGEAFRDTAHGQITAPELAELEISGSSV